MEKLSDANFYLACIPSYWRENKPQFFNCGDRNDTLKTYFKLQELHERDPNSSYLSPDLLFALVDIDLYTAKIGQENYAFADTEAIFHDLYQDLKLQIDKLPQHRIWVTGLMHKESYFLNPDLQSFFDDYPQPIDYREHSIDLHLIYRDMVKELPNDPDLSKNLTKAVKRICHCKNLETTDTKTLAKSWQELLNNADEELKTELLFVLLAIAKSKPYWKQIMTADKSYQRDALSLEIAKKFYAIQDDARSTLYHLPCFFKYLYDFWHDRVLIW
jgi:hypothetical protein